MPDDYYGFSEVDLVVAHSDQCGGHYYQWLLQQGIEPSTIQGGSVGQAYDSPSHMVWKTSTPEALYPTSYITSTATSFLQARAKSRTHLLWLSFPTLTHTTLSHPRENTSICTLPTTMSCQQAMAINTKTQLPTTKEQSKKGHLVFAGV